MPKKSAQETPVLDRALECCEHDLMALPGVSGVALGEVNGRPHLLIYVDDLTPALRARIAPQYEGVPVKVEVAGRFEAQ